MNKIVLMYHDIFKDQIKESGFRNDSALIYKVSSTDFEQQMQILSSNNNVEYTFDDGGVGAMTAIDLLDKYHVKGHFFIATDFIGTSGFLNESQIREIRDRGHFIGAHTASHPHNLPDLNNERITKEWVQCITKLEEILGETVDEASIPTGNYDKRTLEVLSKYTSVTKVYTSDMTTAERSFQSEHRKLELIGRYGVRGGMTPERVHKIVSSPFTRKRMAIKNSVLYFIRRLLGEHYYGIRTKLINVLYNKKK